MGESKILVPVKIEALIVDTHTYENESWKSFFIDYENMTRRLGVELETGDLKNERPKMHPPGVHLHWALPSALTNGHYDKMKDAIIFPAVPNRWMVMRIQRKGKQADTKTWIIESDYIDKTAKSKWAFQNADGSFTYTKIGRAQEWKDWNTESNRAETPLTAIAAGNPTFAAMYQSSQNVFGFYDDLSGAGDGFLSYMVAGWYSDAAIDPLSNRGADMAKRIKSAWVLQDNLNEDDLPQGTLCNGYIHSLYWDKTKVYDLSARKMPVNVGVGYTSIEAKSVQIANLSGAAEKLVSAYFYDLLKNIEGATEIETKVDDQAFAHIDGGTLWEILRKEDTADRSGKENIKKSTFPDPLTDPDVAEAFHLLNLEQHYKDRITRNLDSLYVSFRIICDKIIHAEFSGKTALQAELEKQRDIAKNIIDEITGYIARAEKDISRCTGEIEDSRSFIKTGTAEPEFELVSKKMPRFWKPNDPVVVCSGPGVSESSKYKIPGGGDTLSCRLPSGIISHIILKDDTGTKRAIDTAGLSPVLTPKGSLNAENLSIISKLYNEALLLDPQWAIEWAYRYYGSPGYDSPNANMLAKQLKEKLDAETDSFYLSLKSYNGNEIDIAIEKKEPWRIFLDKISVMKWSHPWTPIHMIWYVDWMPSYEIVGGVQKFAKDKWVWKDKRYTYKGAVPDKRLAIEYSGKAILTDGVTGLLNSRLPGVAMEYNISQALSSFSDALLMRKEAIQLPLLLKRDSKRPGVMVKDTAHAPYLKNKDYFSPNADMRTGNANSFFPIRAGHIRIKRLWITDAFGQIQKVIDPDAKKQTTMQMYVAGNLAARQDADLIQLSPRIIQPSRLLFRWINAQADTQQESTADPETSPVCGWLMPDRLNRCLNVYDGNGKGCGAVKVIDNSSRSGGIRLAWSALPGTAGSDTPAASIKNIFLLGFVNGLLGQSIAGDADKNNSEVLDMLFKLCNDVALFLDTPSAQSSPGVAGLIGQPIALVRAALKFELKGLPVQPQEWGHDIKAETNPVPPGLEDAAFPVSLGDTRSSRNGLIGYFTDNGGFDKMTLAYGCPDTYAKNRYFSGDDMALTFKTDNAPEKVTLLMDPRGGVQADCGLLPSKFIDLPDSFTDDAMRNIEVNILVAPFLSPPARPYIPVSMEQDRTWVLLRQSPSGGWEETSAENQTPPQPGTFNTQKIQEGYLVLKPVTPGTDR